MTNVMAMSGATMVRNERVRCAVPLVIGFFPFGGVCVNRCRIDAIPETDIPAQTSDVRQLNRKKMLAIKPCTTLNFLVFPHPTAFSFDLPHLACRATVPISTPSDPMFKRRNHTVCWGTHIDRGGR
ncbi:MAG: hypothetical protein ACI8RE_002380 [Ilumatobacter sp.]|jgi:hypothetical protein